MPDIQQISFTSPYGAEELDIERRRRLAEALQQQSAQPLDINQTAGGWVIPVSPLQGMAKIAQGVSSGLMAKKADEKQKELAARYQSDLSQALVNAQQAAGAHLEAVDTSREGTGSFDMGGTAGPAQQIVPGSREKVIQALMSHPATQPLALQQMQQDLQRQAFMAAGGIQPASTGHPVMSAGTSQSLFGTSAFATPNGGSPVGFGGPAGGQPMALWLQMDPTGAKYVEQLAKDYAPISTRYGIFQKQPDGSIKAVAGALPQGALSYLSGGGVGALPGQTAATQEIAGATAAGRVPYEPGTTSTGAQMPNYMIPGFQSPPTPGTPAPAVPQRSAAFPVESADERKFRQEGRIRTLNMELADEQQKLATAKTPEDRQLAQNNIDALNKELVSTQGKPIPAGYGQTTVAKERQTGIAKSSNEYVDTLRQDASSAVQQNRILDDLQENLNRITPGKLAAVQKSIAEWKIAAGIGDANDQKIAASSQVVDKLTGQLVSNALRKLSARPSQMEFQIFLQKFVPNLNLTAQGAQQVVQFMRQSNNMDAQKYDEFQTWKKSQPSDADYRDFDVYWNRKLGGAPLGSNVSFGRENIVKNIVNSGTQPTEQPKVVRWDQLK